MQIIPFFVQKSRNKIKNDFENSIFTLSHRFKIVKKQLVNLALLLVHFSKKSQV